MRVWPSSTYTRVTVESNRVLKYKQFALSNPERVVVDLEGVNLNSVLKGMAAQIRGDDPFIKSARVGQFDPQTVRMVFELKQNVKPQLFALAPVAAFKERLVMDLYPANATDIQDPLRHYLRITTKAISTAVPPAQSGPKHGKAGRDRPIVIMLDPATAEKIPAPSGNIAPAKRCGAANCPSSEGVDRQRGQYARLYDAQRRCLYSAEGPRGKSAKAARGSVCLYSCGCLHQPPAERILSVCPVNKRATSTAARYRRTRRTPRI